MQEPQAPKLWDDARTGAGRGRDRARWHWLAFELTTTMIFALVLAVAVQAAVAKPYLIPSESMLPTLEIGERVVVDRLSYRFREPKRGDIVVFRPPAQVEESNARLCSEPPARDAACSAPSDDPSTGTPYIKRIVAEPGDRLAIREGRAIVNGDADDYPTLPCKARVECDLPAEITIPEGHYFMMGDNRGASLDSRAWGPVPEEWIIGKARLSYWPPRRIGLL